VEEGFLLLKSFAKAIPDIAFIIDEDGRYVEVLASPEREDLLYKEAAALKGKTLHEVLPKGRADLFLSVIRKTIEAQQPQTLEYSLKVRAGKVWFEGRSAPLDFPGNKRMAVWVAHDITERRRASRSTRSDRARLIDKLDAGSALPDPYGLSLRERAVLELLAVGKPDREIATILEVSQRTVSKHVENILAKMDARSRTEAAVKAVRDGLLG
jgi:PAS domain S-box-containing protein